MEKVEYRGWPNCRRIANPLVELIVTADVGPRVIRFGFVGKDNEFREYEDMVGKTGGDEWRLYGGHRLWHAPEAKPRSYWPDNAPVGVQEVEGGVRFVQEVEPTTGIQKEIDVRPYGDSAHVEVVHRIRNTNLWPVTLAPWALSVMAQGGRAILPAPPRGSHERNLLPTHSMTMWAYTDMADPRWFWGGRFVMLRQDPAATCPQKLGMSVPDGWAAYARGGHLFLKKFAFDPCATYPDFGCSVETFTNADMLELETVAPLATVEPGECVEHVEHWFLFDGVPVPESEADVDRNVLPKVREAKID
jgi:hypothetical protein